MIDSVVRGQQERRGWECTYQNRLLDDNHMVGREGGAQEECGLNVGGINYNHIITFRY